MAPLPAAPAVADALLAALARPRPALGLLDIGPLEFLVLAIAAVMLFGGELPDVMRRAGRWVGKLRDTAADLRRNVNLPDEVKQLSAPAREVGRELSQLSREAAADATPPAAPTPAPSPATPRASPAPPAPPARPGGPPRQEPGTRA